MDLQGSKSRIDTIRSGRVPASSAHASFSDTNSHALKPFPLHKLKTKTSHIAALGKNDF
jgi:hypothetical protein